VWLIDSSRIKAGDRGVFHRIAPVYGLFYHCQEGYYSRVLDRVQDYLDLSRYKKVIDIGCGTGAFCSVLNRNGFIVTGVDSVKRMLDIAARKQENEAVRFLQADILKGLPFEDKCFDAAIASFVAHGLEPNERKKMYAEMRRITKSLVIIHDFNENRSLLLDIIERLEGGDYFNFIKNARAEMEDVFRCVEIIGINTGTVWYVCRLK
jgi:ubiquinone/menaquinone biosynthesis C-methylase UbiE